MQAVLGPRRSRKSTKLGRRQRQRRQRQLVLSYLLALHEQHDLQNAVFCEESFGKNYALYGHLMSHSKMSIVFGTGRSSNYIVWKPAKWAKYEITNKPCTCTSSNYENTGKNLWLLTKKQNMMLTWTPQILKNQQSSQTELRTWSKQHAIG